MSILPQKQYNPSGNDVKLKKPGACQTHPHLHAAHHLSTVWANQ